MSSSQTAPLDIAIVGGGVAGVYAAHRLLIDDAGKPRAARPTVALFEQSGRIGGRLLSLEPPDMPGVRVELGGMRFVPEAHPRVAALVETLNLQHESFDVHDPSNLVYIRGRHFRQRDLDPPSKPGGPHSLYGLDPRERELDPRMLMENALEALMPGVTKTSGESLKRRVRNETVDGQKLKDYGFWNLLSKALSHEAYLLARAVSGYDSLTLNYNAASTAEELLGLPSGTPLNYQRIRDGFDSLPRQLAGSAFNAGVAPHYFHDLASITRDRTGLYHLTFRPNGSSVEASPDQWAQNVILAMPRRALERVALTDAGGKDLVTVEARRNMESVRGLPLLKIFITYDHPWWRAAGVSKGRSLTDLPLRQCYYWADGTSASVILASYDDEDNTQFWSGLRDRSRDADPPDRRYQAGTGASRWIDYQATDQMRDEAHRQLVELHGVKYAPRPLSAVYRDWASDPYGGGSHVWNVGVEGADMIEAMIQPFPNERIFVCGEAYSPTHGWVEGALETADMVLEKLGVPEPGWL